MGGRRVERRRPIAALLSRPEHFELRRALVSAAGSVSKAVGRMSSRLPSVPITFMKTVVALR